MSNYTFTVGTSELLWQIGLTGPKLKNNVGNVDVRNAADTAFVNVRVADALINDDAVTLRQLNAFTAPGATTLIRIPIALVTVSSVALIPTTARVVKAVLQIVVAYVFPVAGTIELGQTTAVSSFMTSTQNNPLFVASYEVDEDVTPTVVANPLLVTITGAPTAGSGFASVYYAIPLV